MKSNRLQCLKQTIIFVFGLIIGGILLNPLSTLGQVVIAATTGFVFYLTQKVSFPVSTKKGNLN
jgi:hypothetical protein